MSWYSKAIVKEANLTDLMQHKCPDCGAATEESSRGAVCLQCNKIHDPRRVVVTYEKWLPSDLGSGGNPSEKGWDTTASMVPDSNEQTAVDKAIEFMRGRGANEVSTTSGEEVFYYSLWEEGESPESILEVENFYPRGFTAEEETELFNRMMES